MNETSRRWIYKYANKNYSRVANWIEYEDLIQEGYVAYYEVRKRYPAATQPAHIQSLLQLVFRSRIEDIIRKAMRKGRPPTTDTLDAFKDVEPPSLVEADTSGLQLLLIQAPKIIKDVLGVLTDPVMRDALDKPFGRINNGRKETLNDRLCALLGVDSKKNDVVKQTRMYFSHQ